MATKNYTTKTASLKATTADIRKVEAKKVQSDVLTVKKGEDYINVLDAIDNAAISVGRDEDKNWGVDSNEVTNLVKQINFLGDYVNVVPATDGSGKVQVYIGENKSLKGVSSVDGKPTGASWYVYENDKYTVTGIKSVNVQGTKAVGAATGYDAVTLTAKTTASNPTISTGGTSTTIFTTDSKDNSIWFRVTVNGTTGSTYSQSLASNLSNATLTKENVTLTTSNTVVTTDHAKNGKIPGQTETSFKFTFDPDNLVKDGGSIKLQWAIAKTEPSTWNDIDLFYATHTTTPTISAITASLVEDDKQYTDKVSGMRYLTSGSKVNVQVASIANSQKNVTKSLKRVRITDPTNTSKDYAIAADGTMTNGMTETSGNGAESGDATYAISDTLTTGTGVAGSSFTISGKAWDYNDADNSPSINLTGATIPAPYYGNPVDSTILIEKFSKENMRTDAEMNAWGDRSETLFTGSENIINGRVPAIVQHGKLYHPSNANIIADIDGNKPSTSDSDAVFYRVIKQSETNTSGCSAMKLEGTNLTDSKTKLYLTGINNDGTLQAKTWIINALSSYSDSIGTGIAAAGKLSGTYIEFDFNTSFEAKPAQNKGFLLTIVMAKGAAPLGPMTFSAL